MDDKQIIENLKILQNKVNEINNKIKTSPYEKESRGNDNNIKYDISDLSINYVIYLSPFIFYVVLLYIIKPEFIKEEQKIDNFLSNKVLSYPLLFMYTLIFTFVTDIIILIVSLIIKGKTI